MRQRRHRTKPIEARTAYNMDIMRKSMRLPRLRSLPGVRRTHERAHRRFATRIDICSDYQFVLAYNFCSCMDWRSTYSYASYTWQSSTSHRPKVTRTNLRQIWIIDLGHDFGTSETFGNIGITDWHRWIVYLRSFFLPYFLSIQIIRNTNYCCHTNFGW